MVQIACMRDIHMKDILRHLIPMEQQPQGKTFSLRWRQVSDAASTNLSIKAVQSSDLRYIEKCIVMDQSILKRMCNLDMFH